jgi:hypothetical protein
MSCKSEVQLDDHAGNQVTVRCELEKGHLGSRPVPATRTFIWVGIVGSPPVRGGTAEGAKVIVVNAG